jgi:hypothetical protein
MTGTFRTRLVNIRPVGIGHNEPFDSVENTGVFYFRHDVLDQLPDYMKHVKKMASSDPDAFALYSKLGGTLLPPSTLLASTLNDVDVTSIPSFSCVMLGKDKSKDDGRVFAKMGYLQKIEKSPFVAHDTYPGATTFRMVLFYSPQDDPNFSLPVRYHVSVRPDGSVRLLRELLESRKQMRSKTGPWHHRNYSIPVRQWDISDHLRTLARENDCDVETMAQTCFCLLASVAPRMRIGFQIRASKNNGPRAVFNIAAKRTPYFFKDRDITVNENGRTKRVFHYVAGHQRSDGSLVRPHVRGVRSFAWNGYNIHIGIPDMTMPDIRRFKSGVLEVGAQEDIPLDYVESEEAGERILRALEAVK